MKTVLVAMSGGVDSSVASALLKKRGFKVVGVFFRLHADFKEAEEKALMVAKKLGIELVVFDYRKEFKKKIIKSFLKANKEGLTPNPCVLCNKIIKFDLLFENLKDNNADYLATGHYVRLLKNKLFEARDKEKDQSYFLWKLDQKILEKALFPIGDYTKKEIRKIAKEMEIPVHDEPESQEICFIPTDIEDFLNKNLGSNKGKVLDLNKRLLGTHQGLWLYTIGQRKRIGLSGGPYYVVKKDIQNNILIVSKNKENLLQKEFNFKDSNWISGKEPKFPIEVNSKIRSRHLPAKCVLNKNHVVFKRFQRAVTPGQSAVFYRGKEMLGGGIIV